jgi:hypothetical protein
VEAMEGVIKELFVSPAKAVPPEETVYHRYCPLVPPDAFNVREPIPHRLTAEVVGAVGVVLMVAVTAVRELSHIPLLMET